MTIPHLTACLNCSLSEYGWCLNCVKELQQERDTLLGQLPEGMKHCTIVCKECKKGHHWLTATNWVQHGCPTCERDELKKIADGVTENDDAWHSWADG